MNFLQGKPIHIRRRVAAIATGFIGIILIVCMIVLYAHPRVATHDPEQSIMNGYATILEKVQSLFHRK